MKTILFGSAYITVALNLPGKFKGPKPLPHFSF